jgi:hypothetical protein
MNPRLARLLVCLYPRPWRERYGEEFEALLVACRGGLGTFENVVWSALHERAFPTRGVKMNDDPSSLPLQSRSWCVRAPWAIYSLGPLLLLGGTYLVACLILWSGWGIFLPESNTPFVRINGFAIFYFGAGRLLYFSAPFLIGWGLGFMAARERIQAAWPVAGLALISLASVMAQVQATRAVPGGNTHVSMGFALGHSLQAISSGLFHALIIFSVLVLPYLIWRLHRAHSLSA